MEREGGGGNLSLPQDKQNSFTEKTNEGKGQHGSMDAPKVGSGAQDE